MKKGINVVGKLSSLPHLKLKLLATIQGKSIQHLATEILEKYVENHASEIDETWESFKKSPEE